MGTGGGSGPVWTRGFWIGQDKKKWASDGTHSLETVDVRTGQDTESKPASKGTAREVRGRSGQLQDTEQTKKVA